MKKMTGKQALSIISRYAPCPHDNADTSLGNGKVWAKCDDCGSTFEIRVNHGKSRGWINDEFSENSALCGFR